MRVLVVDDEPLIALMNEDILIAAGHEVVGPAASVNAALILVLSNKIDLALLDVNLGWGGNGVELARCLYERHGITSLFASGSMREAREGSDVAIGLLSKPYGPNELVLAVAAAGALLAGVQPGRMPLRMELF
jgi:DNA-binding response OmpR family regulator